MSGDCSSRRNSCPLLDTDLSSVARFAAGARLTRRTARSSRHESELVPDWRRSDQRFVAQLACRKFIAAVGPSTACERVGHHLRGALEYQ
jgi:hypothetical protein